MYAIYAKASNSQILIDGSETFGYNVDVRKYRLTAMSPERLGH